MSNMPISYLNSLEGLNKRVEKLEEGGSGGIEFPQITVMPDFLKQGIELIVNKTPTAKENVEVLAIIPYYSPVPPKSITIGKGSFYSAFHPNENNETYEKKLSYDFSTSSDTTLDVVYSTPVLIYTYFLANLISQTGYTHTPSIFVHNHFYLSWKAASSNMKITINY